MSKYILRVLLGVTLLLASASSYALPIDVGRIIINQYETTVGGGLGGVDIIAHYNLNDKFDDQDCCEEDDLRWLQRVTSSKPTGFTPDPNRPFIDPRSDQPGGFDSLPWYDATFSNLQDALNNQNRQFGSGAYIMDQPRVLLNRGPYSFFAETLLVCIDDIAKKQIGIIGGFSWGFNIAGDQTTVTSPPITQLNDNAALRNSFNTALGLDFPGWTILAADQLWPDETPFVDVPEPQTIASLFMGLLLVIGFHWRRNKSNTRSHGEVM